VNNEHRQHDSHFDSMKHSAVTVPGVQPSIRRNLFP